MKPIALNTKADWLLPMRVAEDDGTKYGLPTDLTGSTLRFALMDRDGETVAEASTEAGTIIILDPQPTIPDQPVPNLEIKLDLSDRDELAIDQPSQVPLIGDLYRSTDGSLPTEWVCRISAILYLGA